MLVPVVITSPAVWPRSVLLCPPTIFWPAPLPIAVLLFPVQTPSPIALYPTAVVNWQVVPLDKANAPTAVLSPSPSLRLALKSCIDL